MMSLLSDMLRLPLPIDADTPAAAAVAVSIAGVSLTAAVFLAVRGVLRSRGNSQSNLLAASWAAPVLLASGAIVAWLLLS